MNTGITPKKKTPSFFGGLFVSKVRCAQKLGCPLGKKSTEELIGISVIFSRNPEPSHCHGCAAFLSLSIMAIPIPVSGKGSARITSTLDSCNS